MTIVYLTGYNTECYGLTFENNGCIKVQKFEKISNDKNNICYVKPLEVLLGKNQVCDMTIFSGSLDKSVIDGNTILLKISEENIKHKYVYIGGDMVCSSLTNDKVYKYISNMGNRLTPYSIAIGMQNIYFLTPHFHYIKKGKINDGNLLETNNISNDPFYYCISQCGKDSFKKIGTYKTHSNYD